jgi:hypothetical protein
MLQAIKAVVRTPQASSLYCVWIRSALGEDAPLVAIWIDQEVRAFADESVSGAVHRVVPCEDAKEEDLPPSEFQPTSEGEW